jgi:hypothetical protein
VSSVLTDPKRPREPLLPDEARAIVASRFGEVIAELVVPMVEELFRSRPPQQRLFSERELIERGFHKHRLRWMIRTYRAELEAAGAIVRHGSRGVLIDPELFEDVIQGVNQGGRRRAG